MSETSPAERAESEAQITELAVAAGTGDRSALAEFIRLTQGDVWRLIARLSGQSRADDLTRETFLRAIPALCCVGHQASARLWLLSLARDLCSEHPARVGEADELLANLTPDLREVIVLTQVMDFSYADAAEIVGCSVAAIRKRVWQARQQLVQELHPAGR